MWPSSTIWPARENPTPPIIPEPARAPRRKSTAPPFVDEPSRPPGRPYRRVRPRPGPPGAARLEPGFPSLSGVTADAGAAAVPAPPATIADAGGTAVAAAPP